MVASGDARFVGSSVSPDVGHPVAWLARLDTNL